jgi:hypothetical protein
MISAFGGNPMGYPFILQQLNLSPPSTTLKNAQGCGYTQGIEKRGLWGGGGVWRVGGDFLY